MHPTRTLILLAALLLLALPSFAVDNYHITINKNSPATINTGLVIQSGDRILIQAEGALRLSGTGPLTDGWFDPSGLGRQERAGQIFSNSPYGILIGSYFVTLNTGFVAGDLAAFPAPPVAIGNELLIGVNMSASDLSTVEGAFKVHITRFTAIESDEVTVIIDANSARPLGTGIVSNAGDQFLVLGQGAARIVTGHPVTDGWFDASGLGFLERFGQVFPKTSYGSLLGTNTGSLIGGFSIGDVASWNTQFADEGDELMLGLNMSDTDQAVLEGSIVVNILRIGTGAISSVNDGGVPGADAIASVDNYPNPFNPMTTVRFELNQPQAVRISIMNVDGELVQTLASRTFAAGNHHLNWDGRNASGHSQASGIYFLRLDTDQDVQTHKLTLVR